MNEFELYIKIINDKSKYQWPKDEDEARLITRKLLDGLSVETKAFREVKQRFF